MEADARGPYVGGVGYFAFDGNMDNCTVLRTAIVKVGEVHVHAGVDIVADLRAPCSLRRERRLGWLKRLGSVNRATSPSLGKRLYKRAAR